MDDETRYDVVVVGGGSAGLSAALTLVRSRRRVLVVDAGQPRNRFAGAMHGVLGHDGLASLELVRRGRKEVAGYGGEIVTDSVLEVRRSGDGFTVVTADGGSVHAESVVVTTGLRDDLPDIEGMAEQWGRGVVQCPYCDGYEVRDGRIGVVATGPSGVHHAGLVRNWSDDVRFLHALGGEVAAENVAALEARGVVLDDRPVRRVISEGDRLVAVEVAGGELVELDAVFVAADFHPLDGLLVDLGARTVEGPMGGSWVEVDAEGRTSVPGVWAAGNVTDPRATVPVAIAQGAMVAVSVNTALVARDTNRALAETGDMNEHADVGRVWDERYRESNRVWSGRPNRVLVDEAATWAPGRALDLGSGEGGDALWLAELGWDVLGLDVSEVAVQRAREQAAMLPHGHRVEWRVHDLEQWVPEGEFDLVSAHFLQSWIELDAAGILRTASSALAPGGRLLVVNHAEYPPWSTHAHDGPPLLTPDEIVASLALPSEGWQVERAEVREREAHGRAGVPGGTLRDAVVIVRRSA